MEWNVTGDMKNKETRIHPTQKPVALYKWLLDKLPLPVSINDDDPSILVD